MAPHRAYMPFLLVIAVQGCTGSFLQSPALEVNKEAADRLPSGNYLIHHATELS